MQVVAGIKFVLTVAFRTSSCLTTLDAAQLTPELCPMTENSTVFVQAVTIVWQPWEAPMCSLVSIGAVQPPPEQQVPTVGPSGMPPGPMPGLWVRMVFAGLSGWVRWELKARGVCVRARVA